MIIITQIKKKSLYTMAHKNIKRFLWVDDFAPLLFNKDKFPPVLPPYTFSILA